MARFTILLAGRAEPTPALRAAVEGTRVVAADAGIRHAGPLGIRPDLWVGDFDSAATDLAQGFDDVSRETFSPDKDRTDGEIAIEAALTRGATSLLLVGALGGPRSDHAFAHLILALRYAERGIDVTLFDGVEQAVPLPADGRERRFDLAAGTQFSLLKFSDLMGLDIAGARYPLTDVSVPFLSILTQSNEAAGPVSIALRKGRAILIWQADAAAH